MTLPTFLSLDLSLVELLSYLLILPLSRLHISSHLLKLLSQQVRASLDLLAVKTFDELIHWLVYFRCKLNQWNCILGIVGQVLDVCVFLCGDLYLSSGSCPGKNKFSVD